MKFINKLKNKIITIDRKIKLSKNIIDTLINLQTNLKGETLTEQHNREELVNRIKSISSIGEYSKTWDRDRQSLRSYMLKKDPRNFIRWQPVIENMYSNINKCELDYLINNDWDKWSKAIKETWVGNPPKYKHYKDSGSGMINMAYSLAQLVEHYKLDLRKFDKIVEFGGGYGCMAKLIHNLGFKGEYTIFDMPEVLALQKYYLNSNNLNTGFKFVEKTEELSEPDIFIATWSLSESPISVRDEFLDKIGNPKYVLIGYQGNYESIDNVAYFNKYKEKRPDYVWIDHKIAHLGKYENRYLIGNKKF